MLVDAATHAATRHDFHYDERARALALKGFADKVPAFRATAEVFRRSGDAGFRSLERLLSGSRQCFRG